MKSRLGLEAIMSRLGLEAMMSRLDRFGPRSSSGYAFLPLILPLDPPLAISYRNHRKSLAYRYFSHLAPLILFFFTKKAESKEFPPPKYAYD